MPISKTDFVRGLQCQKMLWLDAHCPEEKIIPPEVQEKLDEGNRFGDKAMGVFGEFVETTAFREDGRLHFSKMIENTQRLLQEETPVICEAAFSWYGNFCAADILQKQENGYILYEVKNAYSVREEFVTDLGFQRLLLRKCGVKLLASKLLLRGDSPEDEILLKNGEGGGQVCVEYIKHDNFTYKIIDVTAAARRMERKAEEQIFALGKLKRKDAEMPCIEVGEQCEHPYRCWYYDFCRKTF